MPSCFILLNREKIDLSYGVLDVILEDEIHTIMSVTPQAPVSILNSLDPKDFTFNMRYFPRISPNSLKIPPYFLANIQTQSLT